MSQKPVSIDFRGNTQRVSPQLQAATRRATQTALVNRAKVVDPLGETYWQSLRQAGHELRLHAITHLPEYLTLLEERVSAAGGEVHWACDADEASRIVLEIARQHQVKRVVKVKSMLSEEIGLNHALADAGIQALETDLGEYIVQLAGQTPSHLTAPALHLTRYDVASIFKEKLGIDAPPDPAALAEIARGRLREEFLAADMGISGGNFLVAETGTLVLVTNEGNGRMCTALPPLHVAVVGIEKVLPDWESLTVVLKLLARSATGQKITAYTTLITGVSPLPAVGDFAGQGPSAFHLVLVDNGRTRILQDEIARETLLCIRCGACMNICPVYNAVGGHAYGWVYPGPIGAILAPQLLDARTAGALPFASTLCGACGDICPVKIPIPAILLHLRHRVVEGDRFERPSAPVAVRAGARAGSWALSLPRLYEVGSELLKVVQAPFRRGRWLPALPPPLSRWTMSRPLPAFRAGFRGWWRKRATGLQERGRL